MRLAKIALCLLPLAFTLPAVADTVVNGTDSIWLAGQTSGTSVTGYFGTDTATGASPVAISIGGAYVTFSASGSVSVNADQASPSYGGPAGDPAYPSEGGFSPSPWGAMYNGPGGALVGIFTDGTAPTLIDDGSASSDGYVGPDLVDSSNFTSTPALDEIFVIGVSGTFVVPTGATELYLGVGDALGGSGNNAGSFTVADSFSNTPPPAVTPEPGSLALLGTGTLGLLGMVRRRRA